MTILVGLLLGMGVGYGLRRRELLIVFSGRVMGWAVYLLLFLLGLSVGDNQTVLRALPQLGGQALLLPLFEYLTNLAYHPVTERMYQS